MYGRTDCFRPPLAIVLFGIGLASSSEFTRTALPVGSSSSRLATRLTCAYSVVDPSRSESRRAGGCGFTASYPENLAFDVRTDGTLGVHRQLHMEPLPAV